MLNTNIQTPFYHYPSLPALEVWALATIEASSALN